MIEIGIPLVLFAIWVVFSEVYLQKFKACQTNQKLDQKSFWNNPYIFESIPPVFPTLGIFCTALGITIGIWDFKTEDIQNSIPKLLDGLRLAFIATMAGIIGLIIYQKRNAIIQKKIDESPNRPKRQTDELSAISDLSIAIRELKNDNQLQTQNLIKSLGDHLEDKVSNKLHSLEKVISDQLRDLREEQKIASEKANKNTEAIIKAMGDNNEITTRKFNEFSELLKRNNTEALVEVMKRTTEQFNAQMSDLINRLVKENFNELNNSVKKLNDWQNQNKEQIQKLTEQFQKTTETFNISAITLKEVALNTKALTSEDSKLSQIVKELKKVMIEDGKFQEITNKLSVTIETLESTTESFDETTSRLNDWVKNEKNFKEATEILIAKLEEFRDLNGDVWSRYRQEMSKAVSIVKETSERLGKDLDNINAEFYERLNSTLQNLDLCIQRLIPAQRR